MALPQKVIEQLGREPARTPGWSGQLLMFAGTIFFISLLVYFGLAYGYRPYLDSETQRLKDQLQSFSQKVPVEKQTQLAAFYSQLANLQIILAKHNSASPVFGWLEKNTETNVYFTKFILTAATNQLALGGIAKTMDDVDQQLVDFASQKDTVQRLSVSSISFSNGVWQFDVVLTFQPGFFLAVANLTK